MVLPDPVAVTGRIIIAGAGLVGTALTLPGRVLGLVGEAEILLARGSAVADAAEVLIARIEAVAVGAEVQVDAVRDVTGGAGRAVAGAADVTEEARGVVATAERLLGALAPAAERGAPMLQRFVEELEPHELDSMIHLVDALPALVEHLREDVMPILVTLDRVGPDIHQLLEVTEDLRQAVNGLPGLGFLARRGAEKEAREEAPLSS